MNSNKYTVCSNCKRTIDTKELKDGSIFKCSSCFNTLIVSDPFYEIRKKIIESRNRWIIIGMILGLSPMIIVIFFTSSSPLITSLIHSIIVLLVILSTIYFRKKFSDIIIGIIFCEIGIYTTITQYTLNNFSKIEYIKNIPDLRLQTNLFLLFGMFLIIFGLIRRKNYILL
ncbi:MAG: hypothetical protein KatS3mg068_0532 [Candidatus Sericytochromatia bacterium]|nr:MAG: hypothetical protein KatS3mg068_0532 [Candidatus Sericytochromatia bacterium]